MLSSICLIEWRMNVTCKIFGSEKYEESKYQSNCYMKTVSQVIILVFLFLSNVGFACTVSSLKVQPTCGSNGTITYTITPQPSQGARFKFYLNGDLLGSTTGSSAAFNGLAPGTYKMVIEDIANGCTDSITDVLNPATNGLTVNFKMDSARCDTSKNGRLTLTPINGTPPYTYRWSHNFNERDSIADSLEVGTYKVTVIDALNCPFEIAKMDVKEIAGRMRTIDTSILPTSCSKPNGSIDIKVEGRHQPITFRWLTQIDSFNMPLDSLPAGRYTCIFTDTLGCHRLEIKDLEIQQNPPPKITISGTDSVCAIPGIGQLRLHVTAGDSTQLAFIWDNGVTNKVRGITDSGWYFAVATDNAGCADTARYRVEQYPEKIINLKPEKNDFVKGLQTWVAIDTPTGLREIIWTSTPLETFTLGSNRHRIWVSPKENTVYAVTAKYGPYCELSASVEVRLVNQVINLKVPDIFTPNNDGRNDVYKLIGEDNTIETFEFAVYDRWGNRVFESYDQKFTWDGSDKDGKPLQNGVFPYIIRYTTVNQKFDKQVLSGTILLER